MKGLDALKLGHSYMLGDQIAEVISDAKRKLDRDAIANVLANASNPPSASDLAAMDEALGLDAGTLEALTTANRRDNGTYLEDALKSYFLAVVALIGASIGHTSSSNDMQARSAASATASALTSKFLGDTSNAVLASAIAMLTASGDIETRVRHIVRVLGLSPKQAASIDAVRSVIFEYLAAPVRTTPRQVVNGKIVPAETVRLAHRQRIIAKREPMLSAAQRRLLASRLNDDLTLEKAERLLDLHASKLASFRVRAVAGYQAQLIPEQAKVTAWKMAQRIGILPADQKRAWRTAGDERVRHTHAEVPGMNPGGVTLDQPFHTPLGDVMTPPLEVNCRCETVLEGAS